MRLQCGHCGSLLFVTLSVPSSSAESDATPMGLRTPCPAGVCDCGHQQLLETPGGDWRPLRLNRTEENKLLERLRSVTTLEQLQQLLAKMQAQLGMQVTLVPSRTETRSLRGISIQVAEQPGLCRKVRQSVPAAIRRGMEQHPAVVYALLNAHGGLFTDSDSSNDGSSPPEQPSSRAVL
jgi:hypothetical protein